eukprot:jgi/Tetstr1/461919/TSEL_006997.t1
MEDVTIGTTTGYWGVASDIKGGYTHLCFSHSSVTYTGAEIEGKVYAHVPAMHLHVGPLFGDLVAQHQAMDEESHGCTVTNLIRTLSPKIKDQILSADVQVPTYLELPTVEQEAEAIAATINQRINTPPEVQHAQWLTDTMMDAGIEIQQHHAEPKLLRVGDDNICAISLGINKEDEKFADTLRMAVALTSPVALLRAVSLRTIVIYLLTESEFKPSELLIHPFSQTVREVGELGGNTCHNQLRRTAMGLRNKAQKTPTASLALRAERRPVYTLTMQLTAHHHIIIIIIPRN